MTKTIEVPGIKLPEIDDATRREFLIGVAGLLLLPAGCGDGDEDGEASGETRTVEHALGETEAPVSPQRIAVLDRQATLSHLVALGVIPAAAGVQDIVGREFPENLYPEVEDVESLPISDESFNLEQLAELEPDLMIGETRYIEGAYDELSRIAPTVAMEENPFDYRPALLLVGETIGKRERAQKLIDDFDRRVAEAASQAGDIGTATLLSIFPGGAFQFWSPETSVGRWISEFGGEVRPDLETLDGEPFTVDGEPLYVSVSEELLAEASGESLILLQNPGSDEDRRVREEVRGSQLYQNLPAVQNDRVLTLDVQLALGNSGIQGFEIALEELTEFFARDAG